METDICLRSNLRTIVIDAKYYKQAMSSRFGKSSLNSSHLYQMISYLKNLSVNNKSPKPEGIIIYPTTTTNLNEKYEIWGFKLHVVTIDLSQKTDAIRRNLLEFIGI